MYGFKRMRSAIAAKAKMWNEFLLQYIYSDPRIFPKIQLTGHNGGSCGSEGHLIKWGVLATITIIPAKTQHLEEKAWVVPGLVGGSENVWFV